MKLSDKLKQEAIGRGLCLQWQSEWKDDTSREGLIEKFLTGIDFCIANDWPDKELAKKRFGDIIHEHGIYVDEEVHLEQVNGMVVLLGHCTGSISSDWFSVSDIYILHDSEVTVTASDEAKVYVNKDDAATVTCEKRDRAEIKEYRIRTGKNNKHE